MLLNIPLEKPNARRGENLVPPPREIRFASASIENVSFGSRVFRCSIRFRKARFNRAQLSHGKVGLAEWNGIENAISSSSAKTGPIRKQRPPGFPPMIWDPTTPRVTESEIPLWIPSLPTRTSPEKPLPRTKHLPFPSAIPEAPGTESELVPSAGQTHPSSQEGRC